MNSLLRFLLILTLGMTLFPRLGSAEESAETHFQQGLEAYQKQDYGAAQTEFKAALSLSSTDTNILTNLALTEYKLGHKGWSAALSRRALTLEPGHHEAQSILDFLGHEGSLRETAKKIENWELLREHALTQASKLAFAALFIFCFFICIWLWLSFFGARKRALTLDLAQPAISFVTACFTLLTLLTALLLVAKMKDESDLRATLVSEKEQARTAPSEKSPSLFEIFEGTEVLVRKVDKDWAQVTIPGASTGWISKGSLYPANQSGEL